MTLALLAYPLTVFIVAEPWPTTLRATFLPHIEFSFAFFFIALIARNKNIMGQYKSGWFSNLLVWLIFLDMGAAAVAMFATLGH